MKKETVLSTLDTLADEFDTVNLIEKLLFIEKVEKGLKDIEAGKVVSLEEARLRFEEKWSQ